MEFRGFSTGYELLLHLLIDHADFVTDETNEILGLSFRIQNVDSPMLTVKQQAIRQLNWPFMQSFAECMINGDSDFSNLRGLSDRAKQFVNAPLPDNLPENFSISYGKRLAEQKLAFLEQLNVPFSRRAIMHIWCPEDYLLLKSQYQGEFACTSSMQAFVREDRLHMHVHMRSSNAYRILPIDFYNFTEYQRHIASLLKVPIGHFSMSFGSLHLFHSDLELAKQLAGYSVKNTFIPLV